MRQLRKLAGILIVLATATTTLLAGTPHFDCRCPDGSIKRFCFHSACGEQSYCCSGASCCAKAAEPDAQPKPSCCAKQSKPKPLGTADQSPQDMDNHEPIFRGTSCQKTLADAEIQTSVRIAVEQPPAVELVVFALQDAGHLFPTANQVQSLGHVHALLPPPDLVTTLQRITI